MNKKMTGSLLALLLVFTIALVGCTKKEEPKEAVKAATTAAAQMTSYTMSSQFKVTDLAVTSADGTPSTDSTNAQIVNALKNAEITVKGMYQSDPMQTEMTMNLKLGGGTMNFEVPIVLTQDTMYVKIPQIPMLPLPQTTVGKFLKLDLKQLAQTQGQQYKPLSPATSQKLAQELSSAVLDKYDQATYFKDIKPSDAALPEGVDAKQVVQFAVTNENAKQAVEIFVKQALPAVLDVLSKEEYRSALNLTQQEIDDMKKDIQSQDSQNEFSKAVNDLDKYLTLNQFHINTAINDKNFPVYQQMVMDAVFSDPDTKQNVKVAVEGSGQYSNINEKQTFAIGIPAGDNVITMEQFQKEMGY
ncbi:hypothetical protein [Paenibacillus campi]|uniref:hypothetical protein n=1 Tax=Paenibacillus campi TaxID=3106031 RepID=UPI002AFF779E|nr:hypothetical protein [Paenibacillus sp. SGZ-1014]